MCTIVVVYSLSRVTPCRRYCYAIFMLLQTGCYAVLMLLLRYSYSYRHAIVISTVAVIDTVLETIIAIVIVIAIDAFIVLVIAIDAFIVVVIATVIATAIST